MKWILAALVAASAALVAPRSVRAEGEKIVEIEVVDNRKTNDETVKTLADVSLGDTWTSELGERIKVNLVNSTLFKEVNVFVAPSTKPNANGGVRLTISAKDKISWIIAPTVYLQPGNKGAGVGYGENDLFGEAKKLLMYGQIATADSLFLAVYLDPQLGGSKYFYWRADTYLRHVRMTEYDNPGLFKRPEPFRLTNENYLNGGILLGMNLGPIAIDGRVRGAYVYYTDPQCADGVTDPTCLQKPEDDGWDVSAEGKITYDKRANWFGVVTGSMVQVAYEHSLKSLGSDYDYWTAGVKFMKAVKFWSRHNLVVKGGGGYGVRLPFQQERTSGGVDLRGYGNWQFRGDTKASLTVEYSIPLFTVMGLSLRALAFVDNAYTTFLETPGDNPQRHFLPNQTDSGVSQFRIGMGGGFRIYVKQIVLPLLGVDWGYAPQDNEYHVYFAVGLTEL